VSDPVYSTIKLIADSILTVIGNSAKPGRDSITDLMSTSVSFSIFHLPFIIFHFKSLAFE